MKLCPECGREYDSTMKFCLDDGAELLYGPASMDEPPTAILHETAAPSEPATRINLHTTSGDHQSEPGEDSPKRSSFAKTVRSPALAMSVAVLILAAAGLLAYRYLGSGPGALMRRSK